MALPPQPLDSGAQGPRGRPKALSCRHPHLGWFSVGVRRLEEARATGLACRGAYSRLLTQSSFRSPGGPGVRRSSLWLVGRLYNGRVAALWCVRGYGCRRAWRIMVSPTHGTPFLSPPLHARLVWCWSACVRSVDCRVFFSAAVWLVHGSVSRLMAGLCVVGSIALQPAPAQPDVVLVVFSVSSEVCCGPPVRCGSHCVATGVYPVRCVGLPSSWPAVFGLSGVVRWPVRAWPVAVHCCWPSPTPFVSRWACFVVAPPVVACPRVRLLRYCQLYVWLVLLVGCRLGRLVGLSCSWMRWAVVAVQGRVRLFLLR